MSDALLPTPVLPEREHGLSREQLLAIFESMALARTVDRKLQSLYRQGRIYGGVYSQEGNEAVSVGSASVLEDGDCLFPMHRGLGARLVRGDRLEVILAQLLAKAAGPTAGRDSGLHHDVLDRRIFAMISHLGTQLPVACGAALGLAMHGEDRVALNFTGDGATALGDFHEGLNFAAVLKLPVVLVVENNLYAYSTPNYREFACRDLSQRGPGYGIPAVTVDGTDVLAVHAAVGKAVERAREGLGPSLVEARALRLRGHSESDNHAYVPKDVLEDGRRKDPLLRFEKYLRQQGMVDDAAVATILRRSAEKLETALAQVESLPAPRPDDFVYGRFSEEGHPSRGRGVPGTPGIAGRLLPKRPEAKASERGWQAEAASPPQESTYLQAISRGLRDEMRRDPSVFLVGEDIAAMGGAFKITEGFVQEFGEARVIDAPIAESAILGACIGAALMGLRPVAEMQFADFVTCGFNQLVSNAATWHWRTGTPLPFVVRLPAGGGIAGGPFHSRNPEAWFCHQPGLKVVAPSTPEDALGLLVAAMRDDNPVLYLEHKYLYRRQKAQLPAGDHVVPIGKGVVRREGGDAVVLTWGWMVHEALAAAEDLARERGLQVSVVDLRSLAPFDGELLLERARACRRVLVLHEATLTGGFGGEIAAFVGERAFEDLDAPVRRLAAPDTPVPFAEPLEKAFLPTREKVRAALDELLAY